jgi:hypothetical protein
VHNDGGECRLLELHTTIRHYLAFLTRFSRGDILSFCVAARSKYRMTTPTFPSTQSHPVQSGDPWPSPCPPYSPMRQNEEVNHGAHGGHGDWEKRMDTGIGAPVRDDTPRNLPERFTHFRQNHGSTKSFFWGVTTSCTESRRGKRSYPPNLRALRVLRGKNCSRSRSKNTTEGSRESRRTRVWEAGPAGRRDCEIRYLRSSGRMDGRIMDGRIISWGGHATCPPRAWAGRWGAVRSFQEGLESAFRLRGRCAPGFLLRSSSYGGQDGATRRPAGLASHRRSWFDTSGWVGACLVR